ncbi:MULTISPECIES: MBL fold metallo-hydrolase RNA specificity domain-containing protein [Paraburkholderia]|jgi:metallo-beta-lactamase family protein|uniref:MBL fold metallo-hydrolase n=1 Tax=Paraburkholderia madseniana TaxID=2599607 RepID=A0AAP5B906_9BURK|nr:MULTISPECIES: MBL fold metallo-hydrolase [Paraburkholderia]MCX4145147.1 MBL fold metallo-hydrolase [Paraburkholderia madseniana]MDN7148098.1 MBL fold metallo-hydrolase [Paraburkholderia sp. WS6]MDQ6406978.1 MBL fold metallo-hydrolase [Paraburkholderia madseniana]
MKLTFLGAAETVTGSRYLLEGAGLRVLIDCGLFQGTKNLRLLNWSAFPVPVESLDAVILTHAHLDHSGYLPVLARMGYRGPVYCTRGTRDLCEVLLRDSAKLQEEEAAFANRHGFSKHHPALPLYTLEDAEKALQLLVPREFDVPKQLNEQACFRLLPSGHILGAASVVVCMEGKVIAFSGDVGRPNDPIMRAPMPLAHADYLVVESTYGDRLHEAADPATELADIFARTFQHGGVVVIPCFAVGRAQSILHYIARLKASGRMANVPVFLDSPMASSVTQLYRHHVGEHRLTMTEANAISSAAEMVRTVDESKAVSARHGPMVVIAGSGMATGGRVVHHLKAFAPDSRNTIALVGYQATGTRGAALGAHVPAIKIHGDYVPVRASVVTLSSLSAHADYQELTKWLHSISVPPERTFITHGEPAAADALRRHIEETLHWHCEVPTYFESVELPGSGGDADIHPCAATAMSDPEMADPDQSASRPEVS